MPFLGNKTWPSTLLKLFFGEEGTFWGKCKPIFQDNRMLEGSV